MAPATPKYFQLRGIVGADDAGEGGSVPVDEEAKRPQPLLRLSLHDLSHLGTQAFLKTPDVGSSLSTAVAFVLDLLYPKRHESARNVPATRSITLIVRPMSGVAYTSGLELDYDHKEINFSAEYICGISDARLREEVLGVITHEVVHCFQHNARRTAPGGLIEGIADWVRLHADLAPPHWKRQAKGQWDAGYQHTAYFLDWLESTRGQGTVPSINDALRDVEYDEDKFWKQLFGTDVKELWKEYKKSLKKGKDDPDKGGSDADSGGDSSGDDGDDDGDDDGSAELK